MSIEIKRRMGLPRMRFHVMNRGARRVDIYSTDEDRSLFVHLLGKFALRYHVSVIAWCLMSNHYHLEAEGEGTPLARMMHDLDGTYAKIYNEKYGGSGCLFQGRFKSIAIADDDGLLYVSRYIHANPIAQGIRPEVYRWSSCRAYLGMAPAPEWLDPRPVLSLLGPDPVSAYSTYLEAAPPPRPRSGREVDDRRDFYLEYIRHLGLRCFQALEEVGGDVRLVSPKTVFDWIARKKYGIPAAFLAELDRAKNSTWSTRLWRLDRQIRRDSRLQDGIEAVYGRMREVHV